MPPDCRKTCLKFKIFHGSMPPDPPSIACLRYATCLRHVSPKFAPPTYKYLPTPMSNSVSAATSKSAPPKARMRVHSKTKAFLLDTGASSNLISTHDVDMSQLQLATPGRTFTMWNGSLQKSLGTATVEVYNPRLTLVHALNSESVVLLNYADLLYFPRFSAYIGTYGSTGHDIFTCT